jgi:hypothetical protein
MGKLIDTLHRAGRSSGAAIGFLGRAQAAKPKAAAIAVAIAGAGGVEALIKAGADIVITSPDIEGLAIKHADAVWGIDARGLDKLAAATLKTWHESGADFVVFSQNTPMRALSEPIDGFERLLVVPPPAFTDAAMLAFRALNLAEADAAVLDVALSARDLAAMTVESFARAHMLCETLRFPVIVTVADAPAEEDVRTLARLGVQGIWLNAATPTAVTSLRESLERVPREHENVLAPLPATPPADEHLGSQPRP